jgi:Bacterial archaeo-eukaryotic release factor family 10
MSIPSLVLTRHDHYTPEIRDKILEKLRMPLPEAAYHVLTPGLLRTLASAHSDKEPVLSLYLQLTPDRRISRRWRTYLSSLSELLLKSVGNRCYRKALQDEFQQIEDSMEAELPALGRGVAFFACRRLGLWEQVAVPLPLPDGAQSGPRPYVRPLVRTQDEHDRFVIGLLSQELSRFFVSQMGQVEEVFNVKAEAMRKMLTDHGPKDSYDSGVMEAVKAEARILAHVAEQVMPNYNSRYLLLAGEPELYAAVVGDLGKEARQSLGGQMSATIHARPAEIAAAADTPQRAIEQREEVATVQRLLQAGPQDSAWGVQAALKALSECRVATLVVDDMFARPGARCCGCGALLELPQDTCPICGGTTIEAVEDVVELAIEQTLNERGAFEMVRRAPARQSLVKIGPMAALLRW